MTRSFSNTEKGTYYIVNQTCKTHDPKLSFMLSVAHLFVEKSIKNYEQQKNVIESCHYDR